MTKDELSRACIALGSTVGKEDTTRRALLGDLHTKVDATPATDTVALEALTEELEAFSSTESRRYNNL